MPEVFEQKFFIFIAAKICDIRPQMRLLWDQAAGGNFPWANGKKKLDFWEPICLNTAYLNMGEV
jgi:hypothetical protein